MPPHVTAAGAGDCRAAASMLNGAGNEYLSVASLNAPLPSLPILEVLQTGERMEAAIERDPLAGNLVIHRICARLAR